MSTLPPDANAEQPAQPAQPATPDTGAPQYQAPPAGAYAQQAAGVAADPVGKITANYWLSVFFTWLPAVIFWAIEKDKGDRRATELHIANLNFSLLRTIVAVATTIFAWIPYIGWVISLLLWIGQGVLFVFHIIAAIKAADHYRGGGKTDPFAFNMPMVK